MAVSPKAFHLKEILSFFEDDQEINSGSMSVIYTTFERGYEAACAGFSDESYSKDERLKKIYEIGFRQGEQDTWNK